jgi:hypothetical protein
MNKKKQINLYDDSLKNLFKNIEGSVNDERFEI